VGKACYRKILLFDDLEMGRKQDLVPAFSDATGIFGIRAFSEKGWRSGDRPNELLPAWHNDSGWPIRRNGLRQEVDPDGDWDPHTRDGSERQNLDPRPRIGACDELVIARRLAALV
jgi:hypothetical protein